MEERFIELVKDVMEIEDREILLNDVFRDYSEWDSLTYLSVISMIDDEYDVIIETEEFKKLITLYDLKEAIKQRIK